MTSEFLLGLDQSVLLVQSLQEWGTLGWACKTPTIVAEVFAAMVRLEDVIAVGEGLPFGRRREARLIIREERGANAEKRIFEVEGSIPGLSG
jgi:hypothetical protein